MCYGWNDNKYKIDKDGNNKNILEWWLVTYCAIIKNSVTNEAHWITVALM